MASADSTREARLTARDVEHLRARLNPTVYHAVLHNRFVTHCVLRRRGVATRRVLGLVHPETGFRLDGGPLRTPAELADLLGGSDSDVVLAPASATHPAAPLVLERASGPRWRTPEGRAFSAHDLFDHLVTPSNAEWLVAEAPVPHPSFGRSEPGRAHAQVVTLRAGSAVHVLGGNGASAAPDGTLPFWSDARDLVTRAAMAVPWTRAVAWGLFLGQDGGWRVLSGRTDWNVTGAQEPSLLAVGSSARSAVEPREPALLRRARIRAGEASRTWLPLARDVRRERGMRRGLDPVVLARDLFVRGRTLQEALQLRLWQPADIAAFRSGYLGKRTVAALRKRLNPDRYVVLSRHKYVTRCVLEVSGVRMAPLLGLFNEAWGFRADGHSLRTPTDLEELLSEPGVEPVFKPAAASQGQGVMVFEPAVSGRWRRIDGPAITPAELHRTLCSGGYRSLLGRGEPEWVVERRIRPHAFFARFGAATSAVRIVTLLHEGEVRFVAGSCRLPAPERSAANLQQGAVLVGLDVTRGTLGEGIRKGSASRSGVHPASGVRFAGERVPAFEDLLDLARRAARAMPWLRLVGWDCAADEEGRWHVFEANHAWGVPTIQLAAGRGLGEGPLGELARGRG